MRLPKWLTDWWNNIKGNFEWWITVTVVGFILAGGAWAVTYLSGLLRGYPPKPVIALLIVTVAVSVAIACFVWAVMARRGAEARVRNIIEAVKIVTEMVLEEKRSESIAPPALEPARLTPVVPLPPSELAQVLRGRPAPVYGDILKNVIRVQAAHPPLPHKERGDVNLEIDIQEVLFFQTGGYLLMGGMKEFVLMRLRVTNMGQDEPTAKAWKLTVQIGYEYKRETEEMRPLPGGWVVRRVGQLNTATDEPPAPDLVALSKTEEFKFGKQRLGWIAFELYRDHDAVPPYNAMYSVSITDSLGNIHVGTLEPTRYIPKGEIRAV